MVNRQPGGCDLFCGAPGQSMRDEAEGNRTEQINIIQYLYLIKVLKWKLEFFVVAGDVASQMSLLIRRTHISATDKQLRDMYTRFSILFGCIINSFCNQYG